MKPHIRIPSEFDNLNYQIVKEMPGVSETIFGYDCSIEADAHCMALNKEVSDIGRTDHYFSLEMGPNVPEPELYYED
jgi:hypothetical protein